jgi:hypothetical protein
MMKNIHRNERGMMFIAAALSGVIVFLSLVDKAQAWLGWRGLLALAVLALICIFAVAWLFEALLKRYKKPPTL